MVQKVDIINIIYKWANDNNLDIVKHANEKEASLSINIILNAKEKIVIFQDFGHGYFGVSIFKKSWKENIKVYNAIPSNKFFPTNEEILQSLKADINLLSKELSLKPIND